MDFKKLFTGEGFMPSWHCLGDNGLIGWITIALWIIIFIGYLIIGWFHLSHLAGTKGSAGKTSIVSMVLIFVFCGFCGYLIPLLMMWFPVWYLRAIFLIVLASATWTYVFMTPRFRIIYEDMGEAGKLKEMLEHKEDKQREIAQITKEMDLPVKKLSETVIFGIDENTSPQTIATIDQIRQEVLKLEKIVDRLKNQTNS